MRANFPKFRKYSKDGTKINIAFDNRIFVTFLIFCSVALDWGSRIDSGGFSGNTSLSCEQNSRYQLMSLLKVEEGDK